MKATSPLFVLWSCARVRGGDAMSPHFALPSRRTTTSAFVTTPHASARMSDVCPRIASTSLQGIIEQPSTEQFKNLVYATDNTAQLLRDELKSRLITAADDFKTMKAQEGAIARKAKEVDEKSVVSNQEKQRWFVLRLLSKIVHKISRSKKNASGKEKLTKSEGILTSDSFRQMKLEVGVAGERVIEIAEQLSLLNPTPIPTLGFKSYGGAPPTESKLAGTWKLRFTTAADASFPESEKRGIATTSQVVDAQEGTLTNIVDFERGTLKGFRVIVAGDPFSATDIGLSFRAVKILRESRFPRLFGQFTVRLPTRLIRWLASRNKSGEEKNKGPYLQLRYLDEDLRMHITDSGNWFIQTRLDN